MPAEQRCSALGVGAETCPWLGEGGLFSLTPLPPHPLLHLLLCRCCSVPWGPCGFVAALPGRWVLTKKGLAQAELRTRTEALMCLHTKEY